MKEVPGIHQKFIHKQTCDFRMQVSLGIYYILVDTTGWIVFQLLL